MPAHARQIPARGATPNWNGTLIDSPGHGSMYSTQDVERALTALAVNGDNVTRTLEELELDISDRTLRDWRRRYQTRYDEIRRDLAPQIEQTLVQDLKATAQLAQQAAQKTVQAILDADNLKDPAAAAQRMATVMGISIDKALLLEQRPTSITLTQTADDVLRELAAYVNGTADEIENTTTSSAVPAVGSGN